MTKNYICFGLLLALAGSVAGCDDAKRTDNDGGTNTEDGGALTTSKLISAKDGGEISFEGATLTIPAGALAEDTKITLDVMDPDGLPGAANVVGNAYDFGPDGLAFLKPVTLELEADSLPGGDVTLAFLDGTDWTALDNPQVAGNKVTAETSHFTTFAIVVVDGGQTSGQCDDSFTACGGDIVGEWMITGGCSNAAAEDIFGENPFDGCEGYSAEVGFNFEGSVTFESGGAFTNDLDFSLDISITLPKSCTGGSCLENYSANGDNCTSTTSMPIEGHSGTWEANGNSLTITGESDPEDYEYCVTGNKLVVSRAASDSEPEIRYEATRVN
ncbi:MAG: hypothetical protein R3A78_13920 [Polyangiales bacterium]